MYRRTKANWIIGMILISMSFISCAELKQSSKTAVIIQKLQLVETQKMSFNFAIEQLKLQASEKDSIKGLTLEQIITDEEIVKKISETLEEVLSDKELNDIYNFVESSAFDKLITTGGLNKAIVTQFQDTYNEIDSIKNNFSKEVEKPAKKFEPIPVNKPNGFYETVDYVYTAEKSEIKWAEKPSLTSKDILEVKKVFSYDHRPELKILFTKEGAKKFAMLTQENIRKPIAIVIAKHIVSMPTVYSEISGGIVSISGDFSEEEIDKMMEILERE